MFVYLAFRFYLFSHDLEWKGWFGKNYGNFSNIFIFITGLVWNLAFLYFSIRHYQKYRAWLNENYSDEIEERKTLLADKELEKLKNKLSSLMQNDKLYFEPNLTLKDLSKQLGINLSVLFFPINNGFGKNFNDFVNEFQINEVKEKLKNEDDSTLLGVAFDCGFNSKATFNRAFKKITGVSQKEFLQNYEID